MEFQELDPCIGAMPDHQRGLAPHTLSREAWRTHTQKAPTRVTFNIASMASRLRCATQAAGL